MIRYRALTLFGGALIAGAMTLSTFGVALAQPAPSTPTTPPAGAPWGPGWVPGSGMGAGMMGADWGGPGTMGPGMMTGAWTGTGTPLQSMADAQGAFQAYIDRLGNPNLALDEVMEFSNNFYAVVKDKSTDSGAFELLANKPNGAVFLELGPAMMWNTQYGHGAYGRGGMMGAYGHGGMMGTWTTPGAAPTVSADRARELAQQWLDANLPGNQSEEPDAFPGYYTAHFGQGGQVTGMLSVNAYTGQVWYHTWHGALVSEVEVGG